MDPGSVKHYVIRAKHQQKLRFIRVSKDELNITAFLDKGLY